MLVFLSAVKFGRSDLEVFAGPLPSGNLEVVGFARKMEEARKLKA